MEGRCAAGNAVAAAAVACAYDSERYGRVVLGDWI